MIVSTVPIGAGLSSSAALEVAVYTFLEVLSGKRSRKLEDKVIMFSNNLKLLVLVVELFWQHNMETMFYS